MTRAEGVLEDRTTIFIISGLADIDVATNQSMKNTVKYLSEFGYTIHVFAAFPRGYPTLQDPEKLFNHRVRFHRSPRVLRPLFHLLRKLKDVLGRAGRTRRYRNTQIGPNDTVGYYAEYNFLGRLFFVGFLLVYGPLEVLRVLLYYRKYKPSVLYGINGPGCAVASLLGKLVHRPVIHRWTGSSYTEADVKGMKERMSRRLLLLDGGFAKSAPSDAVIMTDDGTRGDKILQLLNVAPEKIRFWRNGIDLDDLILPARWDPEQFRASLGLGDKKVILMGSRLVLWKRVDRGIRGLFRLMRDYGRSDAVLLVAGSGPERGPLEKLALSLGVAHAVRFLGSVPHEEMAKYYSIASLFLSLYDVSNLGNPLIEAMYLGKPIITIDDDSVSGLLTNGKTASLVPVASLDRELPARMHQLLEDQALSEKLGEGARVAFLRNFVSWKERILLEHDLIQQLLRTRPAG